jgi:formate hydrogenlyase subunit 3/multisubunit Na+/H+ antiporter MnhD subunit
MNVPLLLLIAVPFVGGLLVIFPGRFLRLLRWIFTLLTVLVTGLLLVVNFMDSSQAGFRLWNILGSDKLPQFFTTPVGLIIAAAFVFIFFIIILYSFGYFRKDEEADTEYYSLMLFMLGSALGLLFTEDLVFIYLFWEIAAVTTWRLIGFDRTREKISIAARTILINFVGSALMLVGFLLLVSHSGSLNLGDMAGQPLPVLAGIFILCGIFAKSAVIPLYIWVPAAYAAAPTPVVALLAGIVENFGLIVFMKVFVGTFVIPWIWDLSLLWIALGTCIVAGGAALVVNDYRRILGYSTVSQLAFVLAGFAISPELGMIGAILFIIAHGLGKAALLMGYGAVEREMGSRDIRHKGRLVASFPIIFTGVIIASLSVIGLPPLLGFFAKIDVIYGIISSGRVLIGAGFMLAAIFTLLYMLRLFSSVFLMGSKPESRIPQPIYLSILVFVISLSLLGVSFALKPLIAYIGAGG